MLPDRLRPPEYEPHGELPLLLHHKSGEEEIRRMCAGFNPDTYVSNWAIFNNLIQALVPLYGRNYITALTLSSYPLTAIKPDEINRIIRTVKSARTVDKNLQSTFDSQSIECRPTDFPEVIDQYLDGLQGNGSIFCPDHIADPYLIAELIKRKNIRDPRKVALFVLDSHCDAGTKRDGVEKQNFIRYVLDQGLGAVSVYGMEDSFALRYTKKKRILPSGEIISENQLPKVAQQVHDYYRHNSLRFSIPSGYRPDLVDLEKMVGMAKNQLKQLAQKKIDKLLWSVDADALFLSGEGMWGATEYNPLAMALFFGQQNMVNLLEQHGVSLDFMRRGKDRVDPTYILDVLTSFVNSAAFNYAITMNHKPIDGINPGGLFLDQNITFIKEVNKECARLGISTAIPVNQKGGKITGTINEFWGLDPERHAARCAKAIYQAMNGPR